MSTGRQGIQFNCLLATKMFGQRFRRQPFMFFCHVCGVRLMYFGFYCQVFGFGKYFLVTPQEDINTTTFLKAAEVLWTCCACFFGFSPIVLKLQFDFLAERVVLEEFCFMWRQFLCQRKCQALPAKELPTLQAFAALWYE